MKGFLRNDESNLTLGQDSQKINVGNTLDQRAPLDYQEVTLKAKHTTARRKTT